MRAFGADDGNPPRTPSAWIRLPLSPDNTARLRRGWCWSTSASVPNPVPIAGHFNRALLGNFWRAPKGESWNNLRDADKG